MKKPGLKAEHVPEGLAMALCALSFFRHRNEGRPVFKNPKSAAKRARTMTDRPRNVRITREYIKKARLAGFRGSVHQQAEQLWGGTKV